MTEMLLEVEPIKPRWVILKERHDIVTVFDESETTGRRPGIKTTTFPSSTMAILSGKL